ncbi:MAG TPA: hypothetical protein VIK18_00515, partial [Pirellulales bacterium]
TSTGIPISSGAHVKLPPPTLADGLAAADQQLAIKQIAGPSHPLEALVRRSVVAPLVLKISNLDSATSQTLKIYQVDLWFVAYGSLDRIGDEQFLKQQFEAEVSSSAEPSSPGLRAFSSEELAARHLTLSSDERLFAGKLVLFDRVRLNLAILAEQTRGSESVLVALMPDRRLDGDPQYPNTWEKLMRDSANKLEAEKPQPYRAAGGYVKATRLAEPSGAVFIEYHMAFEEPRSWFEGANLLRSKLPLICQDGVRKFRRRIAGP